MKFLIDMPLSSVLVALALWCSGLGNRLSYGHILRCPQWTSVDRAPAWHGGHMQEIAGNPQESTGRNVAPSRTGATGIGFREAGMAPTQAAFRRPYSLARYAPDRSRRIASRSTLLILA